jgi:NAD(P)-dependent dehydrogenase (short-subunit alcohol dehydrogenase family)
MFEHLRRVPVPDLAGRRVFVTGAGRGIGLALVRLLAENGATVTAGVRDREGEVPEGVRVVPLDVTSDASVAEAVAGLAQDVGGLDVLVNNAGMISRIAPLREIAAEELVPALQVNAVGLHRVSTACLSLLQASGGLILNAGTGAATKAMEGWAAYCTSKAAARMLTEMQALEYAPLGVASRFVGIPPTDTAMQGEIRESGLNPISKIPQGSLVHPEVPASVLAWLCARENRDRPEVMLDVRDELFAGLMG